MIGSATSWFMVFMIKETYAPAILRAKSAKKRKETGDSRWFSRYDDKKLFWPLLRENLYRPLSMSVKEPICIFWNVYIALIYGVLYLCFVSYPIVFGNLRGWSPGLIGLGYIGIGIGGCIVIASEPLLRKMINAHKKDPETGKPYPEAMVSVVCIAAVCVPVGEMVCYPIYSARCIVTLANMSLIDLRMDLYTGCPLDRTDHRWHTFRCRKLRSLHLCIQLPSALLRDLRRLSTSRQRCLTKCNGRHTSPCWACNVCNTWSALVSYDVVAH
jgi:hypothetical protein